MRKSLVLHPDSQCDAVEGIEVDVARQGGGALRLTYHLKGATADLRLPPMARPARADELWRHTCFEVFVRAVPGEAYAEFNFAPSTQWAAYRFDRYRDGMIPAREIATVEIDARSTDGTFDLQAVVELRSLVNLPANAVWRLGLSAVIEEANGRISYWALAHPPGKPDFHHADSFALELRESL